MKNYYLVLDVKSDATMKQIREAYRRLAKELHPDYYGQDSGPFIDLQEAYAVLSDPIRRRAYDNGQKTSVAEHRKSSHAGADPLYASDFYPEPLIPTRKQYDQGDSSLTRSFGNFGPSFDELFDRLWRNFSPYIPRAEYPRTLKVEIFISPEEALHGGQIRILMPVKLRCPHCLGRDRLSFFECWRCDGAGVVQGEYPVYLNFPPGVFNNYLVEVSLDRFGMSNFYLRIMFRVSEDRLS